MTKIHTCRCRCRIFAGKRAVGHLSAWLRVVSVLMLSNVASAMSAAHSSSNYVMDGSTTYCWKVGTSIYSNTVDGSSVNIESAEGDGCPLKLSIAFPSNEVYVYDSVAISWNATERLTSNGAFETNKFGLTNLAAGLDRITQNYYEIVASRLRTCSVDEDCNAVTTGSQLSENTTNIPLNFTNGQATFDSSELSFNHPGDYILLAHLILPSSTPTTLRYDYAVYLKVHINSRSNPDVASVTTTSQNSNSSAMSTQVICILIIGGIVVVVLAVIGFVTLRSRVNRNPVVSVKQSSKKGTGLFGFSRTGVHSCARSDAPMGSDGEAEVFAMLSMHEATIRQDRGSTFLNGLDRDRRSKTTSAKKGSPLKYVGPVQSLDDSTAGDLTSHTNGIETPATGDYVGMENTPMVLPPNYAPLDQMRAAPGQIMFNDIMEDEVMSAHSRSSVAVGAAREPNLGDSTVSDVTDLNLTAVSMRIKQHCADAEQEASVQMKQGVLTADDLRESETKGPMELSDLLASRVKK